MLSTERDERVLIVAPVGQDAAAMARLLVEQGFTAEACDSAMEVCRQLDSGAGALVLTEEALELSQTPVLMDLLKVQPPWSEIPLIILTRGGESRWARLLEIATHAAGSVTLLERPMAAATLVCSVQVALRSRRRQYQVRDLLVEQQRREQQLRESERLLRSVTSGARAGLAVVNSRYEYVFANEAYAEVLGLSEPRLTGRCVPDALAFSWSEVQPHLDRALAGDRVQYELSLPPAPGETEPRFAALIYEPHRDQSGQPTVVVVVVDVTARRRGEDALRRAEQNLRDFVENASVGMHWISAGGVISWANQTELEMLGYSREEYVGHPISQFHVDAKVALDLAERFARGESLYEFEVQLRRKDGSVRDMLINANPFIENGLIAHTRCFMRDITERKAAAWALRASEERYRTLVSQVRDYAIFRMDKDGRPTSWNEGVRRVLGFEERDFIGQSITSTIFAPEDQAQGIPERELAEAARVGTSNNDRWLRRRDGTLFFARGVTTGLRDEKGAHIGFTKVLRDATAEKQADDGLKEVQVKLNEHATGLERVVARRTAELVETNEQLEAFVYSIAHDLRAPLRSITGFSQILLEDHLAALDSAAQHLLQRIHASSEFMDRLLLDLLAFGRTARAEIELGPVVLKRIWERALAQLTTQIEQSKARIEAADLGQVVRAHEATLGQVLVNLLSNSLKFVPPGVQPHIRVRAEGKGPRVLFWLEDNGIGIPLDQHERVFRVFERLHGSRYAGTGIGLSIVRKGVERIGGTVGFESEPGRGTRFWIDLPKAG